MSRAGAVVAGHLCLDIIPGLDQLPLGNFERFLQPGNLIEIGPASFSGGGPVSNTGLALHRLGIPTRLIGKTGEDFFGQIVHQIIRSYDPLLLEGIHSAPDVRTSYTVILNPPGIDRIFLHYTGANDTFNSSDIDLEILHQADLFHFGYPPILKQMYLAGGAELEKTLRLAKETGVTTSLDMTLPDASAESGRVDWKAIMERTLPYVDIFLPSLRELLFMLRREMYDCLQDQAAAQASPALLTELGSDLLRMGVKIVLIKLGERGVYVRTAGERQLESLGRARPSRFSEWAGKEYWTPGFRAKVVGTTGAGDAAIAGFLSALLRDMSLLEGLTAAAAVGACNVEAPDALSGIPAWPVVQERIKAGWPRLPLDLAGSGWEWDSDEQVWVGSAVG